MPNSCVPPKSVKGLSSPSSQVCLFHESGVGGIRLDKRLSNDQFLKGSSSVRNLLNSGTFEDSFGCSHEQLIIGVIAGVSLIVELDEVEVNIGSHSLFDMPVASILVVSGREVWSLRSMSENGVRRYCSICSSEVDQPLLSNSLLQSAVVFPISISSVKVVVDDELSKVFATCGRIISS